MNSGVLTNLGTGQRILLFSVFVFPVLAWFGPLQDLSYELTDKSLANAGLVYATARAINGLVSVLQTSEVSGSIVVATGSVQLGQVLDPINDLVERFSAVLLVALGSLALQKILLDLVTDTVFNVAVSVLAACTLVSFFVPDRRFLLLLGKAFWVAVFLRFSLVVVVIAYSWVDSAFLAGAEERHLETMLGFQQELSQASEGVTLDDAAKVRISEIEQRNEEIAQLLSRQMAELESAELVLFTAQHNLAELRQESRTCSLLVSDLTCSAQVIEAHELVERLASEQDLIEEDIEGLEREKRGLIEELDCIYTRSKGQSCSWWGKTTSKLSIRDSLERLEQRMSEFTDAAVSLLMSFLLKTVAIPILFLWCLAKMVGIPWANLSRQMQASAGTGREN